MTIPFGNRHPRVFNGSRLYPSLGSTSQVGPKVLEQGFPVSVWQTSGMSHDITKDHSLTVHAVTPTHAGVVDT